MPRMNNPDNDMAYIRRRDKATDVAHGWQIGVQRSGVNHQKFFSDSKWGGYELALATAKRYRDELLRTYPPLLKREMATRRRKTSRSGHIGVTRQFYAGKYSWRASLALPDGKSISRRFAEDRYGRKEARAMAIAARKQLVEQYIPADACLFPQNKKLALPGPARDEPFEKPPYLLVKVSVRAGSPSAPKPLILIRVADSVHGEINRSVVIGHYGPTNAARRAVEILTAALIALTGLAFTARFLNDHAALIRRLPKRGFRLNMPLTRR